MKKGISILLSVLLVMLTLPLSTLSVSAATQGTCGDNLTWTLEDGTLTISGTGDMYDYDPEGGWNKAEIEKIEIQYGVTSIGQSAFSDIPALTSIIIPDSVTRIGEIAFAGCSGLTSITIPDSVVSIGDAAFWDCSGLTSITFPDSVTNIGAQAFQGCFGLTDWGCSGLTSVIIPDSVTYIGLGAFEGRYSLQEITVPFVGRILNDPDDRYFDAIIPNSYDSLKKVTITGGTRIESKAFYKYSSIEEVVITGGVKFISTDAFAYCTRLQSITIPASVEKIEDNAFYRCDLLTIKGVQNSEADRFAKEYDIPIQYLTDDLGDLDGDGEATIADVMEACKVMARESAGTDPTDEEIARGDLDGDGEITIADVMEICKILARGN